MDGHVRKRGDKWYYSFELAKVDGKRKRIERVGGRTKKEALSAMRRAMLEYERAGKLFNETTLSFSDYLDYWYKNYVLINLKYNTQTYYKRTIDKHIKPALGSYHLKALSPTVLQEFINKKYLSGYSKSSLSNFSGLLHKSIKMAVYPYKFIKENPMQYVKLPKMQNKKDKDDLKIITVKDFKRILDRFPRESNFFIPLQIAYNTGFRASEVCGLTWDCVDLKEKTLKVDKILISKPKGIHEFGTPKTPTSFREIKISDSLVKILKQQSKDQKENSLKYGQYYTANNHVCTKENGKPITTNSLKYLSRVVNHELLIDFNFHSLRHTHATMLLEAGVPIKVVQKRLGHADVTTTLNTYAHVTKEMEEVTMSELNKLSKKIK